MTSLKYLLEDVTVEEVDATHLDANPDALGPGMLGWFYVVHGDMGVLAYFPSRIAALSYRLDIINLELNPQPNFGKEKR